jgi:Lipocalin-like domain
MSAIEVVKRYSDAWNRHDADAIVALFVEGGTYSNPIAGDISWNQSWTGTDLVRFYKLDSSTLTITTAPARSAFDGEEGVFILVWEKVQ